MNFSHACTQKANTEKQQVQGEKYGFPHVVYLLVVRLFWPPDTEITGMYQSTQEYILHMQYQQTIPEETFRQQREKSSLQEQSPGLSSSS